MSYFASAQHEKERLQYFASPEGRDDLYQYNQKERRTVLEVLNYLSSLLSEVVMFSSASILVVKQKI